MRPWLLQGAGWVTWEECGGSLEDMALSFVIMFAGWVALCLIVPVVTNLFRWRR